MTEREWWEQTRPAAAAVGVAAALTIVSVGMAFRRVETLPAVGAAVIMLVLTVQHWRYLRRHRSTRQNGRAPSHTRVVHPAYDWSTEDSGPEPGR